MVDSDSEVEEETLFLLDTAYENGLSFSDCWRRYDNVDDFLGRDRYIPVRGTIVTEPVDQEQLEFRTDIDGITIEWNNLAKGLKSEFRHLDLLPGGIAGLRSLYPIVKKHLNLASFNEISRGLLKNSVGSQLIYDGQWETWLGFVPGNWHCVTYDASAQRRMASQYMDNLRMTFQAELKGLLIKNISVKTLAKNNLNDARRMFVLPGDQCSILECLQRALDATKLELPMFRKLLLTFRFGEKCVHPVELPIANLDAVNGVCVHVGHVISCSTADLFWSRDGVRQLTGHHGRLISAYSFVECANFQTSLDGRILDISQDLKRICSYPENIRFMQLYNDLPHRYPKTRVHPVSGSVVTVGGVLPGNGERSLYNDATKYMSEIHNNFFQCRESVCRIEFVVALREIEHVVNSSSLIQEDNIRKLLAKYPVVVPFLKEFAVMEKLRSIGLHLHGKMHSAFLAGKGTGDKVATWDIFQCELAVEKLLWGHPMCGVSRIYSTNLGPGLEYPTRSRTDEMGFISLDPSSCCCTDEDTLPPLHIYSKNSTMQQRIANAAGIFNHLGCSDDVLGEHVMLSLLRDLHTRANIFMRFGEFLAMLKKSYGNRNKRLVGGISGTDLVKMFSTAKKMSWPMVFGSTKGVLERAGKDVEKVLLKGAQELSLGYFPAVRAFDESRNEGLNWEYRYGYWALLAIPDPETNIEAEAVKMHSVVLSVMEKTKLCHTSMYRDNIYPWIKPVLKKVAGKTLSAEDKVKVLVFVSCVALIENGRYVNYYNVSRLADSLPLTQYELQTLEVQCKFQVPGINTVKIYRLHPSIPCKLDLKRPGAVNKTVEKSQPQHPSFSADDVGLDRINEDAVERSLPEESGQEVVVRHRPTHKCYSVWSSGELDIVMQSNEIGSNSVFEKYIEYQRKCREAGLPDRSFVAYRLKLLRMTREDI